MKKLSKIIIITVLLTTLLNQIVFADVISPWAENEYKKASNYGFLTYNLVSENLQGEITKFEFIELAMKAYQDLSGEVLFEPIGSPFNDINDVIVSQAYSYGIVAGDDNNNFNPHDKITREQAATILFNVLISSEQDLKIFNKIDGNYKDIDDISFWAETSFATMLNNNIFFGYDNELSPKSYMTREQTIATINRIYDKYSYIVESDIYINVDSFNNEEDDTENINWTYVPNACSYTVIIKDEKGNLLDSILVHQNWINIDRKNYNVDDIFVIVEVSYENFNYFTYPYKHTLQPLKTSTKVSNIIDTAKKYLGVQYVWGGTTPSGFDCSGFVQYVYKENGYSITRTTYTQWDLDGSFVSKQDLKPGDLVYFGDSSAPHHVGLYIGDDIYIHAPHTGDVIKYSTLSSRDDFCGGKRIIVS